MSIITSRQRSIQNKQNYVRMTIYKLQNAKVAILLFSHTHSLKILTNIIKNSRPIYNIEVPFQLRDEASAHDITLCLFSLKYNVRTRDLVLPDCVSAARCRCISQPYRVNADRARRMVALFSPRCSTRWRLSPESTKIGRFLRFLAHFLHCSARACTTRSPACVIRCPRIGVRCRFASSVALLASNCARFASSVARLASSVARFASSVARLPSSVTRFASSVARFASSVVRFASSVGWLASSVTRFASSVDRYASSVARLASPVARLASPVSRLASPVARLVFVVVSLASEISSVRTTVTGTTELFRLRETPAIGILKTKQ